MRFIHRTGPPVTVSPQPTGAPKRNPPTTTRLVGLGRSPVSTSALVQVSRLIVPGQISWQVHAYSLVGGVFVLSVWLMILSMLIFAAVLTGALITERRCGLSRSTSD